MADTGTLPTKPPYLIAVIYGFVALISMVLAGAMFFSADNLQTLGEYGTRASAEVIHADRKADHGSGGGMWDYYVTVRFTDLEGRARQHQRQVSMAVHGKFRNATHDHPQSAVVLLDPSDSENWTLADGLLVAEEQSSRWTWVSAGFGVLVMAMGLWEFRRIYRRNRNFAEGRAQRQEVIALAKEKQEAIKAAKAEARARGAGRRADAIEDRPSEP